MLDTMDPKCEENLYRKQYGNLKECVLDGAGIMSVFKLDGTSFRMRKRSQIQACYDAGIIPEDAWEEYLVAYDKWLTNLLLICKRTENNICSKCEKRYHISSTSGCTHGEHTPSYDFEIDEDVLKCKIE